MKGLSLTEPWATLVVTGEKQNETRSWKTNYRGLIAIQAAKSFPSWAKETIGSSYFKVLEKHGIFSPDDFTLGSIIGIVRIVEMIPSERIGNSLVGSAEGMFGDYSANRWAWKLEAPTRLEHPIPCKGALSLWDMPNEIEIEIYKQLPNIKI